MAQFDPADDVDNAANTLIQLNHDIRSSATALIQECDAGTVNVYNLAIHYLKNLLNRQAAWASLSAVSGVQAAIRARHPNKFADDAAVTAALSARSAALAAHVTQVDTGLPKDASGWMEIERYVSGALTRRTNSNAGQIATLRANTVTLRDAFAV